MAELIKMLLGMEVGLGPCHIVLDGDPATPKGAQPPIFGPCLVPLGTTWYKMPLGTEVGFGLGSIIPAFSILPITASERFTETLWG